MTAEELDEYNRAKHDKALSLASEAKAKEANNVLDVDRRHPGSFLPGKAQSMWLDDFDPFFSHPANVKVVEKDLKQASALKAKGNEYYKGKYYDTAHKYYSRAIAYCPVGEEHGYSRAVEELCVALSVFTGGQGMASLQAGASAFAAMAASRSSAAVRSTLAAAPGKQRDG